MQHIEKVIDGFIEAMYFADGSNDDKNEDGFYDDGCFNACFVLSNQSLQNIHDLIQDVLQRINPSDLVELTSCLDFGRIGNCIYYDMQGHGVGFDDENISDQLKTVLRSILYATYSLSVYDSENLQIVLTYSTKHQIKTV